MTRFSGRGFNVVESSTRSRNTSLVFFLIVSLEWWDVAMSRQAALRDMQNFGSDDFGYDTENENTSRSFREICLGSVLAALESAFCVSCSPGGLLVLQMFPSYISSKTVSRYFWARAWKTPFSSQSTYIWASRFFASEVTILWYRVPPTWLSTKH